jgi:opacity protein-like surface antigen
MDMSRNMLRKAFCVTALFLTGLPASFAGIYLGPAIVYDTVSVPGIGYNGIGPRLTLGYDDMLNERLYAGAEVYTSPTTFKVYNNPNNIGSLRITYTYGASILPGINFDNTIIGYARLGVVRSRFDNLGVVKSGTVYGLGIQWVLTDLWRARFEYQLTKYNNITNIGHPDGNTTMVGLMYNFS